MKQYTQYIYKDGEWRVVGASSSSPFPQIHGTLADPIDLRELQTGNYLLSGRILIDDNSYMQTSESGYGTQEIPETLFGVQRDDDYDMYIYVTCDYGNFTYEKNNQDNWDLDECNYYANINMIKQSDWDQNDNYSIDYIKNRTHYTTENNAITSLPFYLSDSTNNIYSFSGTAANNIIEVNKPEQGKNFKIILNGTSFNEPWAQRSVEIYSEVFYSALYIGNLSLCWYLPSDDPSLDTGESYLFVYLFDETGYCLGGSMWAKASFLSNISGDETKLVPSTIYWPSYHQLDREYLPYEVGNKAEIFNDLEANSASGSFSHAEGSGTYAQGDYAHAEGLLTYAQGDYAHAEGYSSGNLYRLEATVSQVYTDPLCFQFEGGELEYNEGWIYNSNGKLIGKDFNFGSYGSYSNVYWIFDDDIKNRDLYENLQVGDTIYIQKSGAYGSYSHTEGHGTFANTGGHAEGESTRANGNFSHAEGNTTIANGGASHAEGHGTNASSYYAHAEGQYTLAGGQSSHAEGEYAENISGKASHVEGISTCTSTGDATHAEGYYSMAIGNSSHAEGSGLSGKSGTIQSINQNNLQITVSGLPEKYGGYKGCMAGTSLSAAQAGKRILNSSYNSSTSQYTFTLKSWNNNYTVGNTIYIYQPTVAFDDSAHAEGCGTVAGYNGHSEGALTVASGTGSHAEGLNTEAKGTYQHVQGKYNIVDNNNTYADIIGNGSSDSSRSNAATVDWNGNAWYAGKVTVGSDPINNMDVATKKYVDDNKGTGTITGVSVNGTSVATSGVANITSVPASILSGAIANGVTATTQSSGDNSTKVATTAYVDGAITALPEPMIFKGSLGTGGTITSLPSAAASNEGFTYKVITAGTYASQAAKVGDTFISDGSTWVLIPSGDEPSGTVTSITLNATSPIAIDDSTAITSSGTRTLSHANSGVTAGTYKSVTVNATGHVTGGTNPTTLSGYGITDANINNGVITLGSNTITPLTSEVNSNLLNNTATGSLRTIGCTNDYTIGTYSFAEGRGSRAYGSDSHAEGYNSYSVGSNSHAEGSYSYAKGDGSHAEGFGAKYSGISGTITSIDTTNHQVSVNFGSDLSTIYNSTVGGILSNTNNSYNVSYRITNVSKNSNDNYTFTVDSVANWQVNTVLYLWLTSSALGTSSHAEGKGCIAWQENTHAEGTGTITGDASQHVQGKWNVYTQNMADIVGNGTDAKHRSNAYTLDWSGNGIYAGKLTVGSGPTNNMDVATKQYVDSKIRSGTTVPSSNLGNNGDIYIKYSAS